jgi:conjugative relaxase-like TrwC/TraI family protein
MLTIATINPKQAEEYYQQENYYSKNAALENSEWWGRGAETLGLSGAISDNEVYKNLVNGLSPDGKQALRGKPKGFSQEQTQASFQSKQSKKQGKHKQSKKQKEQSEERAGVDMTFSAPKSVSLACLVGGDKRLESAHRQAVKRTLEFTEKHYPQTRIKKERVQTDNLTVAMWHHDTSRELDPHLHTHCILMNFTQLPDGRWQSRTDENLYYNKMLLGQIYRQELALECRKLGYEIEPQPKELFEIKGYTREQIEAFSKRHEQIVKYLEGREIDVTTESKVWAWRRTRVKKNHEMGRNEKLPYWHEEANLYGIIHPRDNSSKKGKILE